MTLKFWGGGEQGIKGEKLSFFNMVPKSYAHSWLNWKMPRENGPCKQID
jgi:hypothetical protein